LYEILQERPGAKHYKQAFVWFVFMVTIPLGRVAEATILEDSKHLTVWLSRKDLVKSDRCNSKPFNFSNHAWIALKHVGVDE